MKILAKDYGIVPEKEVAKELNDLLIDLRTIDGAKELVFEKGNYYLDVKNCPTEYYHITNTIGVKEYDDGEERFKIIMALHLKDINDLTFKGNGSVFIVRGYATNMAVVGCKNIVFNSLTIKSENPRIYKMKLISYGLFKLKARFSENTKLEVKNDNLYIGDGAEKLCIGKKPDKFRPYLNVDDDRYPTHYQRLGNALKSARTFKLSEDNTIEAYGFFNQKLLNTNYNYYFFDDRRRQVGVFIYQSENIEFNDFTQNYSPSLAIVAQDSKDISLSRLNFSPEKDKEIQMCSVADFMQFCCCRGLITVRDSYFSSANDDVINIHGIHFKITKIEGDTLELKFAHHEAHGFNVFHNGDDIAVVSRRTLLELERLKVVDSELVDMETLKVKTDKRLSNSYLGQVVENVSASPDLLFENNTTERISTRNLLVTTRGKVIIRNNRFVYGKMSILDISSDANYWFESGMTKDVTFENNTVKECESPIIKIYPMNLVSKDYVHAKLTVKGNDFTINKKPCYWLKDTNNVRIHGNKYRIVKRPIKFIYKFGKVNILEKDF